MISAPSDRPTDNTIPDALGTEKIWRVGTLSYTKGGLVRLFFWLLCGDFALAIRDRAIPPIMQLLFRKFGVSDMVTGLIFSSLPAALGMIIGPVISFKSDRLRTRWGRRIPFLIAPVPLIVVSTVGLALCPFFGAQFSDLLGRYSPGVNGSVVILMGIFWVMFEISIIISYAVFGGMINDVVPQEVVGRFFGLFRAVSLIAGIIFFFNGMAQAQDHFLAIFLGIGALYGTGFTLMCLNVKEGQYPPPPEAEVKQGALFAIRTYFKDGFGHSYYLWFFAASILGALCSGPFNLYSLYYSQSIGMSLNIYGKCIALTYTISLFLSYPIGVLADRFHPLRVSMVFLAIYAVVMAAGGFWVRDVTTFGIALVAHGVMSGCIFTAWASLPQRLLPRNKFAEIGSVGGVLGSLTGIFFAPMVGEFLDLVHHDYRDTFYICSLLTLMTLCAFLVVHHKFMALGGPKNYVAPE